MISKKKKIIAAAVVVLLLLVLAALSVWSWGDTKVEQIKLDDTFEKEKVVNIELPKETKEVLDNYTMIALFGLDNRETNSYGSGNSDVIMVARINKDTKEVKLVSIYRDTFLNMADEDDPDAYGKANSAYAIGGAEQAVRMLNKNLDLDIQEYAAFDFAAVADAVDILGGVEIEVASNEVRWLNGYCEETSKVTGKDYTPISGPGTYNLNGVQAVSYGRIRYTAGDDFKRTERQRLVLNKMVEKALASDVGTIEDLIDAVFPSVKTSLTKTELLSLVKDAFSYRLGDTSGFPFDLENVVVSIAYQRLRQDCVIPANLASNVKKLHDFLYEAGDYEVTPSVQGISDEIEYRTGVEEKETEAEEPEGTDTDETDEADSDGTDEADSDGGGQ